MNWRTGKTTDSIVSDTPVGGYTLPPEDLAYYGGYLVAESVDPAVRTLIIASPVLLKACKTVMALTQNDPKLNNILKTAVEYAEPMEDAVKKPKPKADPQVHEVQFYFYTKYHDVFGKNYVASFGKDGSIFKDLIRAQISVAELKWLVDQFFASTDPFIKQSDHSVGVFRSQINKLRNPIGEQDAIKKKAGLA